MATQEKRDYYEVLGVTRTASEQEIEEAYVKRVSEIRKSCGETRFDRLLEANRAHIVLMDRGKRTRYDHFGVEGVDRGVPVKRDYYAVLGVDQNATEEEIQSAYERLILEIQNTGGLAFFDRLLEANRARTVLANPEKRDLYNRLGFAELEAPSKEPEFAQIIEKNLSEIQAAIDRVADLWEGIFSGFMAGSL